MAWTKGRSKFLLGGVAKGRSRFSLGAVGTDGKFHLGAVGTDGKFHLGGWSSNGDLGLANSDGGKNASRLRWAAMAAAAKEAAKTRAERYRQIARGIRSKKLPWNPAGGWNG